MRKEKYVAISVILLFAMGVTAVNTNMFYIGKVTAQEIEESEEDTYEYGTFDASVYENYDPSLEDPEYDGGSDIGVEEYVGDNFEVESYGPDTPISVEEDNLNSKEYLSQIISECVEAVAYVKNGREYSPYLMKYVGGTDKEIKAASSKDDIAGLDEKGFVMWALKRVTGKTLDEAKDPVSYLKNHPESEIEAKDVRIGDIVFDDDGVSMGIIAGFREKRPVVAICNNYPMRNFRETGCVHLTLLKNAAGNRCIYGTPAMEFDHIIRPDVEWIEEDI
ncbi:MAG: hypothetical protein K6G88_11035 [Lachnospiraceae bacterium]|nr:hypothetical protein [Lachnospiraceae bacterium]